MGVTSHDIVRCTIKSAAAVKSTDRICHPRIAGALGHWGRWQAAQECARGRRQHRWSMPAATRLLKRSGCSASSDAEGEQFNGRDAKDQHCKSDQIVFEPNTHDIPRLF
jgi:hypothetical protein